MAGPVGRPGDQEIKPVLAGHNADACAEPQPFPQSGWRYQGHVSSSGRIEGPERASRMRYPLRSYLGASITVSVAVRRSSDKPAFGVRTRAVARMV